jgi:hypothetical protein
MELIEKIIMTKVKIEYKILKLILIDLKKILSEKKKSDDWRKKIKTKWDENDF